jgi:UDP-3-O-acyl-N-acetylglucosamine deacetylase
MQSVQTLAFAPIRMATCHETGLTPAQLILDRPSSQPTTYQSTMRGPEEEPVRVKTLAEMVGDLYILGVALRESQREVNELEGEHAAAQQAVDNLAAAYIAAREAVAVVAAERRANEE